MTEIIIAIALFGVAGTAAMVLTLVIPNSHGKHASGYLRQSQSHRKSARDVAKTQEIEMAMDEVRGLETEISRWERELRALLEKRNQFPDDNLYQRLKSVSLCKPISSLRLLFIIQH